MFRLYEIMISLEIFRDCTVGKQVLKNYLSVMGFRLVKTKLCVTKSSLRELCVYEEHWGRLIGYFGIIENFRVL